MSASLAKQMCVQLSSPALLFSLVYSYNKSLFYPEYIKFSKVTKYSSLKTDMVWAHRGTCGGDALVKYYFFIYR